MRIWDPHFHVWDVSEGTISGHDPVRLFAPDGNPSYTLSRYEADVAVEGIEASGGVVVEAMSVCHVDEHDAAFASACLAEIDWVSSQLRRSPRDYKLVAPVALESPDAHRKLERIARRPEIRGVRQILNFEPSWPRNERLGNLLRNPGWLRAYPMLEDFGLSFDLQLNPSQLDDAARLVARYRGIPVIIGHLGCPTLEDLRAGDTYWEGMRALADLAHVGIKISMLCYVDREWHRNALVTDAVSRVIELFGVDRCSFASNFPVERHAGWSAARLFAEFENLVSSASATERRKLFADSARRLYAADGR